MSYEAAPWHGKRYSYAGWVPNVHSHLSFSLIGAGRGSETSALTRQYEKRLARFACVLQRRETDDFLAPLLWTRWFRPEAIQHFVLIGSTLAVETPIDTIDITVEAPPAPTDHSFPALVRQIGAWLAGTQKLTVAEKRRGVEKAPDEQGMLCGKILVLPHQQHKADRKRQAAMIGRLRERIRGEDWIADEDLDAFAGEVAAEATRESLHAIELRFALFRTGEIRIWFEEEVAANLSGAARREIARQSYFFVKDMVHHHVHHDAKSDQITPLTEIDIKEPDHGEEHWRRDTVWSLSRAVDALARNGKLQDLREAMGILAYADAFQTSLLLYRRTKDDPTEFEPNSVTYRYDFSHIRESLKVQIDQANSRRTTISQMLTAGIAGGLASTALLASVVGAYNGANGKKIDGPPILPGVPAWVLDWLAQHYFIPAIVCGAILWVISKLVIAEDRIGVKQAPRHKFEQALRGAANSLAVRQGWTGVGVRRTLAFSYAFLLVGLVIFTIFFAPYVDKYFSIGIEAIGERVSPSGVVGKAANTKAARPPAPPANSAPPVPPASTKKDKEQPPPLQARAPEEPR